MSPEHIVDVFGGLSKSPPPERDVPERLTRLVSFFMTGHELMREVFASHCEAGAMSAQRLGLSENVQHTVRYLWEQWDGNGAAYGLKGHQPPHPSRVLHFAQVLEVAHRLGGEPSATAMATERRGRNFDPDVVDAYLQA
jgi:response regulator RpfG family c-di-GMP phosphodiesterase